MNKAAGKVSVCRTVFVGAIGKLELTYTKHCENNGFQPPRKEGQIPSIQLSRVAGFLGLAWKTEAWGFEKKKKNLSLLIPYVLMFPGAGNG